jgi:hypothetical protein
MDIYPEVFYRGASPSGSSALPEPQLQTWNPQCFLVEVGFQQICFGVVPGAISVV